MDFTSTSLPTRCSPFRGRLYYSAKLQAIALVVLFFAFGQVGYSQLESTWWYFGYAAGLSFESGTAVSDTSSNTISGFGASVQSTPEGVLQFYFGGNKIINRQHVNMPNGTGLISVGGSEHSTVSIPRPNHADQYYVFSVDAASVFSGGDIGLFYHLVDMKLDNGLGDVVDSVKNVVVMDSTAERIAATKHANGVDYWIAVYQCGSQKIHMIRVTEDGPQMPPVTNELAYLSSNYSHCDGGGMRFSHHNDRFAHAGFVSTNRLELYDFDAATGVLSNKLSIDDAGGDGVEFSADDQLVYTAGPVQVNISNWNQAAVQASLIDLWQMSQSPNYMTGMQYGLDGRIYGTSWHLVNSEAPYMSVINNPNEPGVACGYQDSAVYLQGRDGRVTVPVFPSNYFTTNFIAEGGCIGDSTFFDINYHFIDSVQWDFGDPASGASNTSTAVDGAHVYTSTGNYTVTLIAQNGAVVDTVIKTIQIQQDVFPNLGADTGFCLGQSITLNGQVPGQLHYQWSTGDTTETITVSVAGTYTLTVTPDSGCAGRDTINISAFEEPVFTLGTDIGDCEQHVQSGVVLQGPGGQAQYAWSSGGNAQNETVFSYGTYTLTVTSADGCTYSDQVEVFPDTCLGVDAAARQQELAVYPNPSYGVFTLSASQPQPIQCAVFNSQGVLVKSVKLVGETKLDLSDHGAGIYTVIPEGNTLQPVQLVVY